MNLRQEVMNAYRKFARGLITPKELIEELTEIADREDRERERWMAETISAHDYAQQQGERSHE